MNLMRYIHDFGYDLTKDAIFKLTAKDPELAHELFIEYSLFVCEFGLEKFILDNSANKEKLSFDFSNAAGFNKNGEIPYSFMKYLGFDRNVVGTVTHEPWKGNERPRIKRFPKTKSLVNWMGLPGVGSYMVEKNIGESKLAFYESMPTTINFMSTPGKKGDELLKDLEGTINDTKKLCDRFELNISCPNTHSTSGVCDARSEYQTQLESMLKLMIDTVPKHELYVKVSPDLTIEGINDILDVVQDYPQITGITGTNTTTYHDRLLIESSPKKGGASGEAVRHLSVMIQEEFLEEINLRGLNLKYIAVGGIDSGEEAGKRLWLGASGIQLFTPMIYEGPKLIREIRNSSFTKKITSTFDNDLGFL